MSGPRAMAEVFAERMSLVLAIGEANGVRQRAQAAASGAKIERMTIEDHPGAGDAAASLEAAHANEAAAQDCLFAADARIVELDARLASLDAELAAVAGL